VWQEAAIVRLSFEPLSTTLVDGASGSIHLKSADAREMSPWVLEWSDARKLAHSALEMGAERSITKK
jgi:hypothetical protein